MRDMHCHILPGVDDGAADLQESLAMLQAASKAGITQIVCTPHCRDPYFNYEAMWAAFRQLQQFSGGFPLTMGFEVNHTKLMELGLGWADHLHFNGTNEFLLELSTRAPESMYRDYEQTIYELQRRGYEVIIAHPERYVAIQNNIGLAERLVRMGCKLQVSSDWVTGGRMGGAKKYAKALIKQGLVSYVGSDAHCVGHYRNYKKAVAYMQKRQ